MYWYKRHLIHLSTQTRSSVSLSKLGIIRHHITYVHERKPKISTFSIWLSFSLDTKATDAFVCWMFVVWLELIEISIVHLMAYSQILICNLILIYRFGELHLSAPKNHNSTGHIQRFSSLVHFMKTWGYLILGLHHSISTPVSETMAI